MKKLVALTPIMAMLCACALAVGAAGVSGALGYRWYKGELHISYAKEFPTVWKATKKALKDLHIRILHEESDPVEGYIKGVTQLGKKVRVKGAFDGRLTRLRIRVGLLGDKDYALAIKYKIDYFLKRENQR